MAQHEELLKQLKEGSLKLHALEKHTDATTAMQVRRQFISEQTGTQTDSLEPVSFDPQSLQNRNIENLVGSVDMPLGIAGPVNVSGDVADGSYYIPMATTEGTLVASTSRGAKIIRESGGAIVTSKYNGMTRAPLLKVKDVRHGRQVADWVEQNIESLKQHAASTSQHISLLDVSSHQLGRDLWLRMRFDTDEAMGMNMSTIAARAVVDAIMQEHQDVSLVAISGNLCIDKKPAAINSLLGRGYSLTAEVTVPHQLVESVLGVTSQQMEDVNRGKIWHGGAIAATQSGFNAHFANIIGAVYTATGQDVAHIVDSSQGYITMTSEDEGLYIALTMPSVPAGDVGGGTWLPDQSSARKIMLTNIDNPDTKIKGKRSALYVEVLAAAVLAGDISLHAALAAGQLSAAHKKFGQGNKDEA